MLQTIYTACPRGHHYRSGRFTPGLLLRLKGHCPVCRDCQITSGLVTPFVNEVVPIGHLHHLTAVTSDLVRRQLGMVSDRPDVARLLDDIPMEPTYLNVRDLLLSMEVWMHHKGRPGGAIPERHHTVEILSGTDDPLVSIAYLRAQRMKARNHALPTGGGTLAERGLDRVLRYAMKIKRTTVGSISSVRREIVRLQARLDR